MAGLTIAVIIAVGFRRHDWNGAFIFGALSLGIAGIIWLSIPRETGSSFSLAPLIEGGPSAETFWWAATALVTVAIVADQRISGRPYSWGLSIAFGWSVAMTLFSRLIRKRAELRTRYPD